MFDLLRPVSNDWEIAEPVWPAGVETREFSPADAEAIHQLIYVDAGWAEVPGHPHREFADWQPIFITEHTRPEVQTLAWRGDRLVGVAMGRIFSDGTGWIAQLAVAKGERGRGLGRALLLDGLRRRRDAGAIMLGLSVQASQPQRARPVPGRRPGHRPRVDGPYRAAPTERLRERSVRGLVPGAPEPDGHVQRHVELVGVAHLGAHQLLDLLALAGRDLEHEFVVHLQQQS